MVIQTEIEAFKRRIKLFEQADLKARASMPFPKTILGQLSVKEWEEHEYYRAISDRCYFWLMYDLIKRHVDLESIPNWPWYFLYDYNHME